MMSYSENRSESVRSFFDQTENYLKNTVGIQLRLEIMRQMLGKVEDSNILDVGCGSGAISLPFASQTNHLTLLDISPEMLEIAQSNTPEKFSENVEYINIDIQAFSNTRQYDVVLCFGVLAHVADPRLTIERLANLTAVNGICIVQLTDQASSIAKINRAYESIREVFKPFRQYKLTPMQFTEIVQIAEQNGYHLETYQRYSLALPGMGRLPVHVFKRIQQLSMESYLLSTVGSEVVLKLRKLV